MDQSKSWNSPNRMLLQAAVIIAVVLLYHVFFGKSYDLTIRDGMLKLGIDHYQDSVAISQIDSLTLLDELDQGSVVDGGASRNLSWGMWESDSYGRYHLYMYNTTARWILMEADGQSYIFNCDNKEATANFCAALQELCLKTPEGGR